MSEYLDLMINHFEQIELNNNLQYSWTNDPKMNRVIKKVFDQTQILDPYKYHVSNYNSVYIKFNKGNMGSLRIGDHAGRSKYNYRWNLRFDMDEKVVRTDKKHVQFFYPVRDVDMLCRHMLNYYNKMK